MAEFLPTAWATTVRLAERGRGEATVARAAAALREAERGPGEADVDRSRLLALLETVASPKRPPFTDVEFASSCTPFTGVERLGRAGRLSDFCKRGVETGIAVRAAAAARTPPTVPGVETPICVAEALRVNAPRPGVVLPLLRT